MHEDLDKIRITTDDLEQLSAASTLSAPSEGTAEISPGSGEVRRYGNIRDTVTTELAGDEGKAKIFLRAWFYLGAAGLLGALAGWGLNEPFFIDGPDSSWADMFMIPSVVAAVCLGCAVAESVVEHSARKALVRGVIALGMGVPLGFVFDLVASFFYNILLALAAGAGTLTPESPAWWACRSLAWALFGASAGLVYGVVGRSGKKLLYGLLGGMLGAGVGGALFDPIALMVDSGGLSRAAGFGLFGLATGVAIGLVESALKDRWLYVSAGPLAGKQFILYKTVTTLGRNQGCDIYLFKDPSIGEMHATFEMRGSHVWLMANGPVYISGQPVKRALLKNRDLVRIGRYSFLYQERQRL